MSAFGTKLALKVTEPEFTYNDSPADIAAIAAATPSALQIREKVFGMYVIVGYPTTNPEVFTVPAQVTLFVLHPRAWPATKLFVPGEA